MRSDPHRAALLDISRHIDLALQLTDGFTQAKFAADIRTLYAVTRCLEIIPEASRRLSAEMKARHPAIAWRDIAAAGNVYRHAYEAVSPQMAWDTVRIALVPLREVVAAELGD